MNSFLLFAFIAAAFFASATANEVLGREIRLCQKQYPYSEARTLPDFELDFLTKDDKCYLYCIMSAQRLISNGNFNIDALEFTRTNLKIAAKFKSHCSHIRHSDNCEFAAKLQKCIEIVIRKTPTSHFPSS